MRIRRTECIENLTLMIFYYVSILEYTT